LNKKKKRGSESEKSIYFSKNIRGYPSGRKEKEPIEGERRERDIRGRRVFPYGGSHLRKAGYSLPPRRGEEGFL